MQSISWKPVSNDQCILQSTAKKQLPITVYSFHLPCIKLKYKNIITLYLCINSKFNGGISCSLMYIFLRFLFFVHIVRQKAHQHWTSQVGPSNGEFQIPITVTYLSEYQLFQYQLQQQPPQLLPSLIHVFMATLLNQQSPLFPSRLQPQLQLRHFCPCNPCFSLSKHLWCTISVTKELVFICMSQPRSHMSTGRCSDVGRNCIFEQHRDT